MFGPTGQSTSPGSHLADTCQHKDKGLQGLEFFLLLKPVISQQFLPSVNPLSCLDAWYHSKPDEAQVKYPNKII